VRASAQIPHHAEAGLYRIVLRARDDLKPQSEDRRELTFEVLGRKVPDTKKLTVEDFGLARAENSQPMKEPLFKPGDAVWGRFSILGFALGEGNAFKVDTRLRILDEEDEVLFAFEPEGEQGQSFYPRRWLPGRFRVDLDDDIPPGRYEIELVVSDRIGGQKSQTRYAFEVR
jgi:hypothetical protein